VGALRGERRTNGCLDVCVVFDQRRAVFESAVCSGVVLCGTLPGGCAGDSEGGLGGRGGVVRVGV